MKSKLIPLFVLALVIFSSGCILPADEPIPQEEEIPIPEEPEEYQDDLDEAIDELNQIKELEDSI